jgi:pilus assembly protein CpaB
MDRQVFAVKRRIAAVVVACVLAAIGCGAVLLYAAGADTRALHGQRAVRVLLATKLIPAGTTGAAIRSGGYVELATLPATSVPADAMASVDPALDDLVLGADLAPRQVLLRGAFAEASNLTGGLAIPDGKIAVTIDVPGGAALRFVRPGCDIVVFDTFTTTGGGAGGSGAGGGAGGSNTPAGDRLSFQHEYEQATRVLLPRVRVIAVGLPGETSAATSTGTQTSKDDSVEQKSADGTTTAVTVAVMQGEAERLVHGAQTGTLFVAVLDDSSDVRPGPGVDNSSMFQ